MDFLKKLDFLMNRYELTKTSLSQKSGIPYTTIDAWYKKGYEGLKLTTLRKLAEYFNTTLDYWFLDEITDPNYGKTSGFKVEYDEMEHIKKYRFISEKDTAGKNLIDFTINHLYNNIRQVIEKDTQLSSCMADLKKATTPHRIISYYQKLASAGSGEYLFDNIPTDTIEVPVTDLSEQADFVIGVNGHSMEPTYYDGEKVYVAIASEIPTGSIGVFTKGNECYIKELGEDRLISHNTNCEDISGGEDVKLVGKVIGKVEEYS